MKRDLEALHHSHAIFISKNNPDYNFGETLHISITTTPKSEFASVRFDSGICDILEAWQFMGFSECEQYPLRHELLAYAEMKDKENV